MRRAHKILNSERVWNRADNRQRPPAAKTVSLYCALENATQEVTGYNNDSATTFADIQRVFQLTEARIASRIGR